MDRSKRTFVSVQTPGGIRTAVAFSEQRKADRKALQVNASLQCDDGPVIGGRTVDISTHGICVHVRYSLSEGESWRIVFDLPHEGKVYPIEAVGCVAQRVVGADGIRIGFQFKRLSMASLIAISRYLK
jgi:hypothetical protein